MDATSEAATELGNILSNRSERCNRTCESIRSIAAWASRLRISAASCTSCAALANAFCEAETKSDFSPSPP